VDESSLSDGQIRALISLLDEEDPSALEHVTTRLKRVLAVDPDRIEALIPDLDLEACQRVRTLLEDVRWDRLERRFENLSKAPDDRFDLEAGVHLLATFAFPQLKREEITAALDQMASDLQRVLTGRERPIETIHLVNDYLFVLKGFKGNTENYYDPDNSYFNKVLERRLGIPITLSVLYLLVGRRLALPLVGIGLPGHFIVQFQAPGQRIHLDPFRGGKILSLADCQQILKAQGLEFNRKHLRPVSHRAILARVIANLIAIYTDRGDHRRAQRLTRLFSMYEET